MAKGTLCVVGYYSVSLPLQAKLFTKVKRSATPALDAVHVDQVLLILAVVHASDRLKIQHLQSMQCMKTKS